MANNISSFPLSGKDRGLVCAAKILPTVLFGSELAIPPKSEFGKLRSSITRAVWRKRSGRSPDIVLSLLHPIHRLDPLRAWAYRCLVQLRRMCKRRADLIPQIRRLWQQPSARNGFGPITAAKEALRLLGWTWPNFEIFAHENTAFAWMQHSRAFFQHQLRKINFTASDKRQDLRGVAHAEVDRHTIQMILNRLPA